MFTEIIDNSDIFKLQIGRTLEGQRGRRFPGPGEGRRHPIGSAASFASIRGRLSVSGEHFIINKIDCLSDSILKTVLLGS